MRSKLEVADIFRRHGDTFRAAQGNRLSLDQRKVMAAIEACRTSALGGHVERCEDCGEIRVAYNSCRDRHCPKCQGLARLQWLADRRMELLPVPYFHIVFTVPTPIAALALQNKALVYDILFKAAAETIRVIAADPKHLGAETGMIAILHTWGQTLTHHPHVHCIVPGGGLGPDGRWVACKPNFFLPVHVFSRAAIVACFSNVCERPSTLAALCFTANSYDCATPPSSRNISNPWRISPGSSSPNVLSPAPHRSSIISVATRIASPSPMAVFSIATMAASAFDGRIIAPKTSPRR